MKGFVYSIRGEERNINEDFALFKICETRNSMIFAVADGMGDLDFGNVVSRIAVFSAIEYMEKNIDTFDEERIIENALDHADVKIKDFCIENRCVSGVAIAVGILHDNVLNFSWQGNVRIYLECADKWTLLTSDHKLYVGKEGYRLSRCLKGCGLRDDIPIMNIVVRDGSNLIVCTDGLYDGCADIDMMADIIRGVSDPVKKFKDDSTGILIEI